MPTIYLKQTGGSYTTSGNVQVTVSPEEYPTSNLFKRFKHTPSDQKTWTAGENIKINYSERISFLNLRPDGDYRNKQLDHAYVYFNRFDKDYNNPLLLSLHFKNESPKSKFMYLQYSEIRGSIKWRLPTKVSDMNDLENDNKLFSVLILENYDNNNILIYQINKDNVTGKNGTYNFVTIGISKKENIGKGQSDGFYKYIHTPKYGASKSYILYNNHVLLRKDQKPIEEIQNQEYNEVTVYFGEKAKNKDGSKSLPLLIELTKKSSPAEPNYFVHRRDPNNKGSSYWVNLKDTFKDLLTDMGFGMKSGERGYNELKQLLLKPGVFNGQGETDLNDLSNKLGEVTGKQLQTMLQQQVGQGGSSQKSFLELLLAKIEFDLLDSVVILLDKKGNDNKYGHGYITSVLNTLNPKRDINRVNLDKEGPKTIKVYDRSGIDDKCVKNYGYKLLEHDLSEVSQVISGSNKNSIGIRFLIPSKTKAGHYNQLKLYKEDKTDPEKLQYIYYSTTNKKLYVYFYGKDPRPLLLCYKHRTYKPKNFGDPDQINQVKVDYSKWVRTTGIKKCACKNTNIENSIDAKLEALTEVTGYLNPVQLNPMQIPDNARSEMLKIEPSNPEKSISVTYELHKFTPTTTVQIKITKEKVECYYKYKYEPAGTNSTGDKAEGFRLGTVVYTDSNAIYSDKGHNLDYRNQSKHKYHPLLAVTVYYYNKDNYYSDPLLIELEFKKNGGVGTSNTEKEYYKLTIADSINKIEWQIDKTAGEKVSKSQDQLVLYLDIIRYDLKKVMKILIDKQTQYPLCLSQNAGGTPGGYRPQDIIKIEVEQCKNNGCSQLKSEGYKCYVHKISSIRNGFEYNRIGGLRLFLWDNRNSDDDKNGIDDCKITNSNTQNNHLNKRQCCEIKLATCNYVEEVELKHIPYTVCKGDLYVYFYGDDPRPLLLCYNGQAYRPTDLDTYNEKWCHVPGIKSCQCDQEKFDPSSVLQQLYQTSMFPNPVKLSETIKAYEMVTRAFETS